MFEGTTRYRYHWYFGNGITGSIQEVKKVDNRPQTGLVLGLLAAGRGIGSVVSGPLSEALLSERQ